MKKKRYPMHEKLAAVKNQSQTCGDFLEWLNSKGYCLASYDSWDRLQPARLSTEQLLAQFFRIDLRKLEAEKREMLADIRGEGIERILPRWTS